MSLFIKLLGLVNAGYLLSIHGSKACAVGQSCSEVLSSVYASFFGVPLASLGVSVFLVLLVLDWFYKADQLSMATHQTATLALVTPSAAVGIILMMIQWTQLHAFCPFCIINSLIFLGLFVLAYRQHSKGKYSLQFTLSQWLSLILVALMPLLLAKEAHKKTSANRVIGRISGEEITLAQLKRSELKSSYLGLQTKINQVEKQFIHQKVLEIEAKKNNMVVNQYIQAKILRDIQVSEKEMREFYEEKKDEVPGKSFEDLRVAIRNFLTRKKEGSAIQDHLKGLVKKYDVEYLTISLEKIKVRQNPHLRYSKGNKNANVKIIEFADMQCGHCKHAYAKMKTLMSKYPNEIYFEYRHYPLPSNRFSKTFAKGSYCAGEEGKFFEFVDLSFANQKKLGEVTPADLAETLGLNTDRFDACMKGHVAQKALEADIKEADRLGIQSTPTFIVNGQLFTGEIGEDEIELML